MDLEGGAVSLWAELTGKADKERDARWKSIQGKLEQQAQEREASIPPGYEWTWRSFADSPMRFSACSICGATVEMANTDKHTAWHKERS